MPVQPCGCCDGAEHKTPAVIENAPGLTEIRYRAGTWATFRDSVVARLSTSDLPALGGLRSRDDDDFTIALVDGFAVMADVLTFYQERIANEAFLRTATERRSVSELARLLGYTPAPGVAADAWLAFTMATAAAGPPPVPVTVPAGTKVMSVPGPDETAQTFETVAPIVARAEQTAIGAETTSPVVIARGQTELYVAGADHLLSPGDVIAIVGHERIRTPGDERWDVRLLDSVEVDREGNRTRLAWAHGLGHGHPEVPPAAEGIEVHVFRRRAALYGHNAPDARMLSTTGTNVDALANTETGDWYGFEISGQAVDLDQAYAGVVPGSWLALANTTVEHLPESQLGYVELYLASEVSQRSRSDYGLASKVTHVELDSDENLSLFDLRNTLVLAESERLPLAEPPLRTAVFGDRIELASKQTALARRQPLAVAGARQHLRVRPLTIGLTLSLDDGGSVELVPGDRLTLLEAPARTLADGSLDRLDPDKLLAALDTGADEVFQWTLADRDGRPGRLAADAGRFAADPAEDVDPVAGEIAFVADAPDAVAHVRDRTHLRLQAPLRNVYDRATVTVNANVAPATHGETVTEIVGSGDASQPDQRFPLKQVPLTYVRAPTPSGRASTLAVRVEGALWQEHATLYGAGPADHDYSTETADAGTTTVVFGDGVEGARLPTGSQNVSAAYRKGIGAAANVRAGQLTTLLARPLGVTEVVNPEPATGGQDPEALADARTNAPRTVLTLDRAVSVRDYEDFARAYAGIAKAQATWVATGPLRGIVLTVAGPEGAAIDPGSSTGTGLKGALHDFGDALTRVTLVSYRSAAFVLHATVKVRDDLIADEVLAAARATLVGAFSFVARDFGQRVTIDEVVAVLHRTVGIVAVDVNVLRRSDQTGAPAVRPRLESALPLVGAGGATGAELLTVDADALELGVMA